MPKGGLVGVGLALPLIGKLSSNLVSLCCHDKVIAVQPFYCVCPPVDRCPPIFGEDCRVMAFRLCERANLVRKVKRLHKILETKCPFQTWNSFMFHNVPRGNLWLQFFNFRIGHAW